jgi:hypothetical protein
MQRPRRICAANQNAAETGLSLCETARNQPQAARKIVAGARHNMEGRDIPHGRPRQTVYLGHDGPECRLVKWLLPSFSRLAQNLA